MFKLTYPTYNVRYNQEGKTMDNLSQDVAKNERLLKALLALELTRHDPAVEKHELLLARVGLGYQDIAEVLGKKPDAVRMLLKRNKA